MLGIAYLRMKNPESAIEHFGKALQDDPQNARIQNGYLNAHVVNGIRLFYQGDYQNSERHFCRVLEFRDDSFIAHLYLSSIYRELGDSNRSLQHLDRASVKMPDDPVVPLSRAVELLRTGKTGQALHELSRSASLLKTSARISSDPTEIYRLLAMILFRNGHYTKTVYYAKKVLLSDSNQPDMHVILAESFRNLGFLKKARNHLIRAIERDKQRIELHQGLAMILWEMSDYRALARELRHILRVKPRDSVGEYYTALCLPELGKSPTRTISMLQDQIHKKGPDPSLMCTLGREYMRAGLLELAEGWLLRTLKLVSDHKDTLRALSNLCHRLNREDDHRGYLRQYIDRYPDSRQERRLLIESLMKAESYEEAASEIEKLIPYEPDDLDTKRALADCLIQTGDYEASLLVIRDLLNHEPRSVQLFLMYCSCMEKTGARSRALRILERASHGKRDHPGILMQIGNTYVRAGKLEKAAETFRNLVQVSPVDWRAYRSLGTVYKRLGNATFAERFLAMAKKHRPRTKSPDAP